MSSTPSIEDLFHEWNELNNKAQEFLGQFDFDKIKEIRAKQMQIEDSVFEILKENAPDDIKKILPDDCGEMEVGYETEEQVFYFVTFDPESESEDEASLIAITLDVNKNVKIIEDFEIK